MNYIRHVSLTTAKEKSGSKKNEKCLEGKQMNTMEWKLEESSQKVLFMKKEKKCNYAKATNVLGCD